MHLAWWCQNQLSILRCWQQAHREIVSIVKSLPAIYSEILCGTSATLIMFKTRPITYSEKLCDTKSHRHIASELSLKPFVSGGGMTRLPRWVPPRCGDNRHNMQPCVLLAKMKDVPWGEDAILLSYQHLPCEQDNKSQSAGLETFSVRFVKQR